MEKKLKFIAITFIAIIICLLFIFVEDTEVSVAAELPKTENVYQEKKVESINKQIKQNISNEKKEKQKQKKKKNKAKVEKKKVLKNIKEEEPIVSTYLYSGSQFMNMGVIYWGNYRWTWYSQNILPGGGLNIPGRHLDEQGYVCDGSGLLCLASSVIPKGTVLNTPFGKQGKIYDAGCAPGTIDVYVGW